MHSSLWLFSSLQTQHGFTFSPPAAAAPAPFSVVDGCLKEAVRFFGLEGLVDWVGLVGCEEEGGGEVNEARWGTKQWELR